MAKERTKQCTCCGEIKTYSNFYKSQSPMYKHDQKLPICKQCVEDIYNENLLHYKDEEKALYKTLFLLKLDNILFLLKSVATNELINSSLEVTTLLLLITATTLPLSSFILPNTLVYFSSLLKI